MSDFKENLTFAMDKVDSLFQVAMPHLKNGAEAAIKYAVVDAYMQAIGGILILVVLGVAPFLVWKLTRNQADADLRGMARASSSVVCAFIFTVVLSSWSWPKVTCAVKASVSPAVYTVLKLAGKDCAE